MYHPSIQFPTFKLNYGPVQDPHPTTNKQTQLKAICRLIGRKLAAWAWALGKLILDYLQKLGNLLLEYLQTHTAEFTGGLLMMVNELEASPK